MSDDIDWKERALIAERKLLKLNEGINHYIGVYPDAMLGYPRPSRHLYDCEKLPVEMMVGEINGGNEYLKKELVILFFKDDTFPYISINKEGKYNVNEFARPVQDSDN